MPPVARTAWHWLGNSRLNSRDSPSHVPDARRTTGLKMSGQIPGFSGMFSMCPATLLSCSQAALGFGCEPPAGLHVRDAVAMTSPAGEAMDRLNVPCGRQEDAVGGDNRQADAGEGADDLDPPKLGLADVDEGNQVHLHVDVGLGSLDHEDVLRGERLDDDHLCLVEVNHANRLGCGQPYKRLQWALHRVLLLRSVIRFYSYT